MNLTYKKATLRDIDMLTETRIEAIRAVNDLSAEIDIGELKRQSYSYYNRAIEDGTHIAYLVFDGMQFVGTGGICFYQVMPTYHNPSGTRAYIMNIYTKPEYRRRGIAFKTLDKLIADAKSRGVVDISLSATDMGYPMYIKYGFVDLHGTMALPKPQ